MTLLLSSKLTFLKIMCKKFGSYKKYCIFTPSNKQKKLKT